MNCHFNPSPRYFYVTGTQRSAALKAVAGQNPLFYAVFYLKSSGSPTYFISYDDQLSVVLEGMSLKDTFDIVEVKGENFLKRAFQLNRWQLNESPFYEYHGNKDLIEVTKDLMFAGML